MAEILARGFLAAGAVSLRGRDHPGEPKGLAEAGAALTMNNTDLTADQVVQTGWRRCCVPRGERERSESVSLPGDP